MFTPLCHSFFTFNTQSIKDFPSLSFTIILSTFCPFFEYTSLHTPCPSTLFLNLLFTMNTAYYYATRNPEGIQSSGDLELRENRMLCTRCLRKVYGSGDKERLKRINCRRNIGSSICRWCRKAKRSATDCGIVSLPLYYWKHTNRDRFPPPSLNRFIRLWA